MKRSIRAKIEVAKKLAEENSKAGLRKASDGKNIGRRAVPTTETRRRYSKAACERWRREFLEQVIERERVEAEEAARSFPYPVLGMYDLFRERGLILASDPTGTAANKLTDVLFLPAVFDGYSELDLEKVAS